MLCEFANRLDMNLLRGYNADMDKLEKLNDFFVTCFYSILSAEQRALDAVSNGKLKLSIREIHVIEAVFKAKATGENNFSTIAKLLGVTLGTLTASFSKLEKKGYLVKEQDKKDKRVYYIMPTRLAGLINDEHAAFHKRMIDGIAERVPDKDLGRLSDALKALSDYFNELL